MRSNQEPWRDDTVIILHGGPRDGERMKIPDHIAGTGVLRVLIMPDMLKIPAGTDMRTVEPVEGFYLRRHVADMTGTCEGRHWYEWHWAGTNA